MLTVFSWSTYIFSSCSNTIKNKIFNRQALPDNLGTLVNLELLGLRENMLMELPPTFYLLKALKKLDLSRNGLPSLAIRTPSEGPDPEVVAAWEKVPMPSGGGSGGRSGDDGDGLAGKVVESFLVKTKEEILFVSSYLSSKETTHPTTKPPGKTETAICGNATHY